MLSELAVIGELRDGRLVEVPTSGVDLRRALRAVWRPGARLRGPVAQFLPVVARR